MTTPTSRYDTGHRLMGLLLLASLCLLPAGCKSKEKAAPPPPGPSRLPDPPLVRDVSLSRPTSMRVGDAISIVLDAVGGQIPIVWEITGLPRTWERTTGDDGRFYILTGRIPVGSSQGGLHVRISVRDGNGRRSLPLPIDIDVEPKAYVFQPTLVESSEDKEVREYDLILRSMPDWDPAFKGRLEIWVDTAGLATGGTSLRLWDLTVTGMDMTQAIEGEAATVSGIAETGETFLLLSPIQQEAIQNAGLRLTIRSPGNPNFRVVKVKVTAY